MTKKGTLSSLKAQGNLNKQAPKDTYSLVDQVQDQKREYNFTEKDLIERNTKENNKY
jgi:hypothetical protein